MQTTDSPHPGCHAIFVSHPGTRRETIVLKRALRGSVLMNDTDDEEFRHGQDAEARRHGDRDRVTQADRLQHREAVAVDDQHLPVLAIEHVEEVADLLRDVNGQVRGGGGGEAGAGCGP